ncbi:formylglycine-generating enzyme family protein [Streptomyces sp. 8N706]|uniref:formylglycine-generating enzyme family protein n=1 Tax=Streptomyces sp. 8N706 TaxID=3457416 RepID=UPI003FD3F189
MTVDGRTATRPVIPRFVTIPAGPGLQGDPFGEGDPDEHPVAERELAAFSIAATPTTTSEYLAYLTDTGLDREPRPDLHAFPERSATGLRTGPDGRVVCPSGAGNHPVVFVTWHGARAYCAWLTERLGAPVRLPREAEWQRAAAGPDGHRFALGEEFDRSQYVNDRAVPAPTGERRASPFGLHDITGNVFEWCEDRYHVPPGAADPEYVLETSRLIKGGAFILRGPRNFRAAKRFSADEKSCLDCVGFRVLSDDPAVGAAV